MAGEGESGQTFGPACDQCRSRKVRCDRRRPECSSCVKAGVSCDLTDSKRVNHTKQLLTGFSDVTSRLDSIEANLAKLNHLQEELISSSKTNRSHPQSPPEHGVHSPVSSTAGDSLVLASNYQDISNAASAEPLTPALTVYQGSHSTGGEHFYGATAPISLFHSARNALDRVLHEKDLSRLRVALESKPDYLFVLKEKLASFPFADDVRNQLERGEGGTVDSPPYRILQSLLSVYLSQFNLYTPIFDETRLKNAIEEHYSGRAVENREAWSLCFNNIILLAMCVESRLGHQTQTNLQGMQDEIIHSFLRNSYRCFNDLDRFSELSVVNIQALTTLALVVREYDHGHVFGVLLPRICQMARFMGLQQSHSHPGSDDTSGSERVNLFWSLYRMDKQRCMMTGQPCDIYLFDTDIQHEACGSKLSLLRYLTAHSLIMSLWEDIYISLYSKRAFRRGQGYRREQVFNLEKSFDTWMAQNEKILHSTDNTNSRQEVILSLELRYCYETGRIFIYRSFDSETNQQRCLDSSKAALGVILEACMLEAKEDTISLLGRLFRNYPITGFVEICRTIINEPTPEALLMTQLLSSTINALNQLISPTFSNVYYTRLLTGLSWCFEVVSVIQKGLESHDNNIMEDLSAKPPTWNGFDDSNGFPSAVSLSFPSPSANFSFNDIDTSGFKPADGFWDMEIPSIEGEGVLHSGNGGWLDGV